MAKPRLYLFVGYPGAGKTTVAQLIAAQSDAVHIWADKERIRMFGTPVHSSSENRQLYTYLNDRTGQLLNEGMSVIFDTNFNFYKDRQHLREIAAAAGADATVIWMTTPLEVARRRAVKESTGKASRLFGNMASRDFDRIASHLQPPDESEKVIKIDGTDVDPTALKHILNL